MFLIRAITMRARGTPDVQRIRSLACKTKKAHEHSHHGCAENIWRSARNGFYRLAPRTGPPEAEPCVVPPFMAQGEAPGPRGLGQLAFGVVVMHGGIKKARCFWLRASIKPPRIEHRAQPPHPAPRIVTIAKRPSK